MVNDNAKFLCRDGPAYAPEASHSQKKLCFTSTDRDLLARHLLDLSRREDCYFVKFGTARAAACTSVVVAAARLIQ